MIDLKTKYKLTLHHHNFFILNTAIQSKLRQPSRHPECFPANPWQPLRIPETGVRENQSAIMDSKSARCPLKLSPDLFGLTRCSLLLEWGRYRYKWGRAWLKLRVKWPACYNTAARWEIGQLLILQWLRLFRESYELKGSLESSIEMYWEVDNVV